MLNGNENSLKINFVIQFANRVLKVAVNTYFFVCAFKLSKTLLGSLVTYYCLFCLYSIFVLNKFATRLYVVKPFKIIVKLGAINF